MAHHRLHGEGGYYYSDTRKVWIWRIRYKDKNGIQTSRSISNKDRKILKKQVELWLEEQEAGKTPVNNKLTVKEWGAKWLFIIKPSIKIKTYDGYKFVLEKYIYPSLGQKRLNDLDIFTIQGLFNDLLQHLTPTTVIGVRRRLITMLGFAYDQKLIKTNPAKATKPPRKTKKQIIVLNEEQVKVLLLQAKNGDFINTKRKDNEGNIYSKQCFYNAVNLAINSGERIGEIFGTRWDNINFETNTVRVESTLSSTSYSGMVLSDPKTSSSCRTIQLPTMVMDDLRKWKEIQRLYSAKIGDLFNNQHNLVFTNCFGKAVSFTNFYKRYWTLLAKAANLPDGFTFHGLRHTHATLLLKHGVNIKVVSERLGHSSTSVTMNIYAHCLPDMQETAILELEKMFKGENKND